MTRYAGGIEAGAHGAQEYEKWVLADGILYPGMVVDALKLGVEPEAVTDGNVALLVTLGVNNNSSSVCADGDHAADQRGGYGGRPLSGRSRCEVHRGTYRGTAGTSVVSKAVSALYLKKQGLRALLFFVLFS